ncbi:uncharacterized protein PSFLO_00398 [Pseudozyma flocculosa]|uniref:Uncharacterized protein n=1 Tax=Pseudozyma flocculosa TaxID=84751 RepID=A0A5C3ETS9_9BASI|nr:uncharacterized protein PSFLO_00398 [Pseudozyma flocculosa]
MLSIIGILGEVSPRIPMIDGRSASAPQQAVKLAGWLAGSGGQGGWQAQARGLAGLNARAGWLARLTKLARTQKKMWRPGHAANPALARSAVAPSLLTTTTIGPLPAINPRPPSDPSPATATRPTSTSPTGIDVANTTRVLHANANTDADSLPQSTPTGCHHRHQLAATTTAQPPLLTRPRLLLANASTKAVHPGPPSADLGHRADVGSLPPCCLSAAYVTRATRFADHQDVSSSRRHQIDADPGLPLLLATMQKS